MNATEQYLHVVLCKYNYAVQAGSSFKSADEIQGQVMQSCFLYKVLNQRMSVIIRFLTFIL